MKRLQGLVGCGGRGRGGRGYLPGSSKLMVSSYICVISICRYCLYMSRAYARSSECVCVFVVWKGTLQKQEKFHDFASVFG